MFPEERSLAVAFLWNYSKFSEGKTKEHLLNPTSWIWVNYTVRILRINTSPKFGKKPMFNAPNTIKVNNEDIMGWSLNFVTTLSKFERRTNFQYPLNPKITIGFWMISEDDYFTIRLISEVKFWDNS